MSSSFQDRGRGAASRPQAGDVPVFALFSNTHEFGIIEYPDSDKIGIWGRQDEALDYIIRRSPDLYWEGECADCHDRR